MNSGILSAGFRRIGPFPTVPSMPVSPSSGSSPSTCFINHGIQHSFLSGNSIPIFPLSRPKRKSILLSPPWRIQNPKRWLHSCILPASGSAKSVISVTVILSAKRCGSMLRAPKAAPTAMQSFPKKALDLLTRYWFACGRPCGWLFPKQTDPSRPIDTFYVTRHLRAHEEFLGWEHRFTCHSFRHAFGTHLYENGADLLTIKNLMGHKSLKSTLIYIHLASFQDRHVSSPFDWTEGDSVE